MYKLQQSLSYMPPEDKSRKPVRSLKQQRAIFLALRLKAAEDDYKYYIEPCSCRPVTVRGSSEDGLTFWSCPACGKFE